MKLLRERLDALKWESGQPVFPGGAHFVMRRGLGASIKGVFEALPSCVIAWTGDRPGDEEMGGYQAASHQGRVIRAATFAIAIKGFHEEGAERSDPNEVEWTYEAMDPLLQEVEKAAVALNDDAEFLAIFNAAVPTGDGLVEIVDCNPDPAADVPGAPFMGSAVLVRMTYRQSAADPAVP